jgi:RimJ/RimL family protein N-acetyltransferase
VHWSSIEITTERLVVRPFSQTDANDAFGCITPTLTRYLSFDPAASEALFETIWRGWLPKIDAGVDFAFTIRDRETNEFLGLAGLHRTGDLEPELGIWIREDKHGHGYGLQAVQAVAQWAAETFKSSAFIYPVAKENAPSRKLAEALGGVVINERTAPKYDSVVYRIPAVDSELEEFKSALLRSVKDAVAGKYARVHTPEDIKRMGERAAGSGTAADGTPPSYSLGS